MEKAFEKFNKVVEEYNEAFASAKDKEEQDKVNKSFEKKIDTAEAALEKDLESIVKTEDETLEKEQKAAEIKEDKPTKRYTKSQLSKIKEAGVVDIAVSLGIESSIKDKKSDTIKKILELQDKS